MMITLAPYLYDRELYSDLPIELRQLMNKLHLSELLTYRCGPCGMNVPRGRYCVRPMMNLYGNAEGGFYEFNVARDGENNHVTNRPGYFWCEWFDGPRTFTEFINDVPDFSQVATTTGSGENRWRATTNHIAFPAWLRDRSRYMLIEAIGDKIIEVSFRMIAVNARQSVIDDYRTIEPGYDPQDIEFGLYHSRRVAAEPFRERGSYWQEIPNTRS